MSKTPVKLSLKLRTNNQDNNHNHKTPTRPSPPALTALLSPSQTSSSADFKRSVEVPRAEAGGSALEALAASALSLLPEHSVAGELSSPIPSINASANINHGHFSILSCRPSRLSHLIPRSISASPQPACSSATANPKAEDECLSALLFTVDSEVLPSFSDTLLPAHCSQPERCLSLITATSSALTSHLALHHSITLNHLSSAMHRLLRRLIAQETERLKQTDLTALLTAPPFLASLVSLVAWMPRIVASCVRVEEVMGVVGAEPVDVLMAIEVVLRAFPELMGLPLLSERLKHLQQFLLEEGVWAQRVDQSDCLDSVNSVDQGDGTVEGKLSPSTSTTPSTSTSATTPNTSTSARTTRLPLIYHLIASELPRELPRESSSSLLPLRSPQKALESLTGFSPPGARLSRLELFFRKLLRLGLQRLELAAGRSGLGGEVVKRAWEWFVELVESEGVDLDLGEGAMLGDTLPRLGDAGERGERGDVRPMLGDAMTQQSTIPSHSSPTTTSPTTNAPTSPSHFLFLNAHLNQIIMAVLYTVARLHGSPRTFHQLSSLLPSSPLSAHPQWYLRVGSRDYYTFYNELFLPRMQAKIGKLRGEAGGCWAPIPAAPVHELGPGVSVSVSYSPPGSSETATRRTASFSIDPLGITAGAGEEPVTPSAGEGDGGAWLLPSEPDYHHQRDSSSSQRIGLKRIARRLDFDDDFDDDEEDGSDSSSSL